MDIKNRSALKQEAARSLSGVRNEKQIIAVYTGVTIALSVAVTVLDGALGHAVSGTGGLSNLGTRSLLQTLQSALPILQLLFLLCWDMGYLRSAVDMSRGRSVELRTLTHGFRIFGPALRLNLLIGLILGGILFASMYLGTWIFLFTPFAQPLSDAIAAADTTSILSGELVITDGLIDAISQVMLPMMITVLLVFGVIAVPLIYSYRMANYCLLDQPKAGARAAMRQSKHMMRGRRMDLLKLDLSLWWFYLLEALAMLVSEGATLLPLLGIRLPFSDTVGSYLFYGLYWVLIFGLHVWMRNYRDVIYAKAYDALRPPEVPNNGIVLGNIFQM